MQPSIRISLSLLTLAAVATLNGCDDNGVTASPEAEMILTATPQEVFIDLNAGQASGESTITVQVLEGNFAANGVSVFFGTSGGILHTTCIAGNCEITGGGCTESSTCLLATTQAVETNANGLASVRLTLSENDPDLVTVSARSGAVSTSVEVSKIVSLAPTAVLEIRPALAFAGDTVTFDGSESSDPDSPITCYQLDIDSTIDTEDERRNAPGGIYRKRYNFAQDLTVVLSVSDDPAATTSCGTLPTTSTLFGDSVSLNYSIQ